jgi:BlaI family penicillinase repressor
MSKKRKRPAVRLTEAEWKVMREVWSRAPATARDVVDGLGRSSSWAYTTVKTLLTRLEAKGAVRGRRDGNAAVYEPLVSESEARRSAVRDLVERAFGGSLAPVVRFLVDEGDLAPADVAKVRKALEREARRTR